MCNDSKQYSHMEFIQNYYDEIERALTTFANWCIPQTNCSGVKSRKIWWDDEPTQLKSRAQLCFKVWSNVGKPLDGAEYMEM